MRELIPEQTHERALLVDEKLRVRGLEYFNVFAIGDCATAKYPKLSSIFMHLLAKDMDQYSVKELKRLAVALSKSQPTLDVHMIELQRAFGRELKVSRGQLEAILNSIDNRL